MPTVEEVAIQLAAANAKAEPSITEIYWFPATNTVHLIEVDPTTITSNEIAPFYFGPDPQGGIPFPSGIALIRPEERGQLNPPPDWGLWHDAVKIWPRN